MEPTAAGDRERLLRLVDDAPMDEHAQLVRQLLECDAALVTVLDDSSQHFLGMAGLDPDGTGQIGRARTWQGLPCAVPAGTDAALQLDDLTRDPAHHRHPARTELGIEACIGVPLRSSSSEVIGVVYGLHGEPRPWSERDRELLQAMRDLIEVELRPLLQATQDRVRAEEVSLLLSTLRHELGGELAIVLGGIETAMLPGIEEPLRQRVLANARRDCRRVISTLDALLRVDDRAPLSVSEVDLSGLAEDVAVSAAASHDTDRIEIDVAPCTVTTEGTLLAHVLRNLIDNACKYSAGPVRVTGGPHTRGGQLTVHDVGSGIPDDVVTQLFEPFSRPRDDGGASGFGLGLYIIRRLCDRLGAQLSVDTGEDGTLITVTVPDAGQSPKPSKAASSSDGE